MSGISSLNRFISVRFVLAALVICVLWYLIARDLYWFALDGTSEFYLFEDASQALQAHRAGLDITSLNTPFKQFFTELEQLPGAVLTQLDIVGLSENFISLFSTDSEDIYVLPYREEDTSPLIYVVHRFDVQDTPDIAPVLLLISFAVLFLMFALMWFVVARLKQQTHKLTRALLDVEQQRESNEVRFAIEEFQAIYNEVQSAYQQRLDVLQREKHYSAFLSHEIRHSLASVNANIEKLDQLDGFPLDALSPMEEARRESHELQRIANAILALWQNERLTTSSLNIVPELKKLVAQFISDSLQVDWQIDAPEKTIRCDRDLFHLTIRQLLQNARQYGKSSLTIFVRKNAVKLVNDISHQTASSNQASSNNASSNNASSNNASSNNASSNNAHGYKVGMLLVSKICDTMKWQLYQKAESGQFEVEIRFPD